VRRQTIRGSAEGYSLVFDGKIEARPPPGKMRVPNASVRAAGDGGDNEKGYLVRGNRDDLAAGQGLTRRTACFGKSVFGDTAIRVWDRGPARVVQGSFGGGGSTRSPKADPGNNCATSNPALTTPAWAGEGEHPFESSSTWTSCRRAAGLKVDWLTSAPALLPRSRARQRAHRELRPRGGRFGVVSQRSNEGREQSISDLRRGRLSARGRNVVNLTSRRGSWMSTTASR